LALADHAGRLATAVPQSRRVFRTRFAHDAAPSEWRWLNR